MKEAILITGLMKQVVYRMSHARYHVLNNFPRWPLMATNGEELIAPTEINVTERVVPITQFCRPGKPNVYIAYTEEVEELLGMPISCLLREIDEARSALSELRSMTAWQHVKTAWQLAFHLLCPFK